jgi:tetratricopeptide (TPR) repeat protein
MRRRLELALLFCALCSGHARADPPTATAKQPSEIERLEQVLGRAQDARNQGELKPDRYEQFLVQFRASLEQAWGLSPRTPADSASYARIQARLGDSAQALAALGPALQQDPQNADLRLTFGEVNFERKDYPAALAEANAVLERDPGNKRAIALKRFSEGRVSGTPTEGPSPLQLAADDGGSVLSDPRVVEAGRRATARMNALHFTDKAMTRLRLKDSSEALRYAVLAEASDPTLADAHMQQGLAYMGLKQPGQAYGRFTRAEELWQAKGNEQAAMARTMKERAAAQMSEQPKVEEPKPAPAPDSRRTTWPLGGATAGLLLAGMGASLLKHDEEREQRWRKPVLVASLVGIGVLGGGLLGYAAYAMAAPALTAGGGTLALAGGGTMSAAAVGEGAVLATAAGGLVGGAAGAKAAEGVESESPKREPASQNGTPGQDPGPLPVPVPLPIGSERAPGDCSLTGGEDILLRFVDGTRLAPGFIKVHDQHGGHTEERHIAKSVEFLLARLTEVPRASSFNDMNAAERYIKTNAEANMGRIEAWWRRGGPPESFTYAGTGVVGYGVTRANRQPAPQEGGRIVLTRMNDCRILILTAYPE